MNNSRIATAPSLLRYLPPTIAILVVIACGTSTAHIDLQAAALRSRFP